MILENHLKELSLASKRNESLYQTWTFIKLEITKLLENVSVYFPHYSLHNSSHSETICMQVERLLGEKKVSQLSVSDTMMMLLSFYCHDLGMALMHEEVYEFFNSQEYYKHLKLLSADKTNPLSGVAGGLLNIDFKAKNIKESELLKSIEIYHAITLIIQDYFRINHASRSVVKIRKFLVDKFQIDRTLGIRFVTTLCEICELHQKDIGDTMNLPQRTNGISDDYMHPRLVATMLCLGDLLDLDTDRFNKYLIEAVTPMPLDSETHLKKHESVKHFLVCTEGIELISDCENIKVYRIMRDWMKWIKDAVDFISLNWGLISPKDFGNAPYFIKKDLYLKGNTHWTEFSDLKFTISQKRAIELLQGANIYRSKFVFLRETIQNAVDASVLQMWKELTHTDSSIYHRYALPTIIDSETASRFKINIKVYMDESKDVVLEISDCGTGISKTDLKCIANVGNVINESKKKTIDTMPKWLKPSGAFGLGLQSIFLVADKFEIITKTEDEAGKKVIFYSGSNDKGYIEVEDYKEYFKRGTLLRVKINSTKITQNDLYCSDYDYSTKDRGLLIMKHIFSEIDNQDKDVAPFKKRSLKHFDYIPVHLEFTHNKEKIKDDILYNSIFGTDMKEICNGKLNCKYKDSGNVNFEYYDNITESICKIHIHEISDTDKIIYQSEKYRYEFNQSLFFKNEFVKEEVIDKLFARRKDSLYRHFDFSINILGNKANELLTIDRNNIKKEYEYQFDDLCDLSIENTLKRLLDIVIDSTQYNDLKSTLVKLYQISVFYNYRADEFFQKFSSILEKYSFGNYLAFESDVDSTEFDRQFTFEELKRNNIIFIIDEVPENIFSEKGIKEIVEIKDTNYCVWLKPHKVRSDPRGDYSVLSHQIIKVFICKINNKYHRCIEAKAFYSNKVKNKFEKDIYIILDDFIHSIIGKSRIMYSNLKYDSISVISKKFYSNRQESIIEQPFYLEQSNSLEKIIMNGTTDVSEIESFLQNIFNSELYKTNLKYISDNNGKSISEIDEAFKKFLREVIFTSIDNDYKAYSSYCIDKYKGISARTWGRNDSDLYEKISENYYITF